MTDHQRFISQQLLCEYTRAQRDTVTDCQWRTKQIVSSKSMQTSISLLSMFAFKIHSNNFYSNFWKNPKWTSWSLSITILKMHYFVFLIFEPEMKWAQSKYWKWNNAIIDRYCHRLLCIWLSSEHRHGQIWIWNDLS